MNIALFFKSLRDFLGEKDRNYLLEIIRQDKLIFYQFQKADFLKECLAVLGNDVEKWTLGNIALLSLDLEINLLNRNINEKHYLKTSVSILDETFKNHSIALDYQRAAHNALALNERKRINQSWHGLMDELVRGFSRNSILKTWRTSLAILYSLQNEDPSILESILSGVDPYIEIAMINHIVSVQFFPLNKKTEQLVNLIENQPADIRLIWLQTLPVQNPKLASQITDYINKSKIFHISNPFETENKYDLFTRMEKDVKERMIQGFRFLLDGSQVQARSHFLKAKTRLIEIQKVIDMNLFKLDQEIESTIEKHPITPEDSEGSSFKLQSAGVKKTPTDNNYIQRDEILDLLDFAVQINKKGELSKAREIAEKRFKNWFNALKSNWPSTESVSQLANLPHKEIAVKLNHLGLNGLSAEYLKFLNDHCLPNSQINDQIIQGLETLNLIDEAYAQIKIAQIIGENEEKHFRNVVKLLEKNLRFEDLYCEWEVFSENHELNEKDFISFANAAIQSGHLEKAEQLIARMRSLNFNKTQINLISAKLFFFQAKLDQAKVILEETTRILPYDEEGWIILSNIYRKTGSVQKSYDCLREAVLSIPDSAAIQFNLSIDCLDQGLYSEALPYIRKAIALDPSRPEFYRVFIKTLQTLGRTDEGDQIIKFARVKWPKDAEIASMDALRQLEKHNRKGALIAFEVALYSDQLTDKNELFLLYVQTLLDDDPNRFLPTDSDVYQVEDLILAQKILQNELAKDKEPAAYLRILLGEVYYLSGEYEVALKLYSQLISEEKNHPETLDYKWRIFAGLGLVNVQLEDIESGITMLQEASQLNRNHLGIKQKIAETYIKADLFNQAYSKAEEIFESGSTDTKNLFWYANFMAKLNNQQGEIKGYEQIIHFDPSNSIAITRLADIYINNGWLEKADKVLGRLMVDDQLDSHLIYETVLSYLRIEKYQAALNWLEKLPEPEEGLDTHKRNIEKTFLMIFDEQWYQALELIQKLREIYHHSSTLSVLEGECQFNLRKYDSAVYSFEAALFHQSEHDLLLEIMDSKDQIVPADWLRSKNSQEKIRSFLVQANYNIGKYEHSLEQIDHILAINPADYFHTIIAAEICIRMTDFDLGYDYLVRLRKSLGYRRLNQEEAYIQALEFTCAFLTNREFALDVHDNQTTSEIGNIIQAHQRLNLNFFEDANTIFEKINPDSIYAVSDKNGEAADYKRSILQRTYFLLAWRLKEFPLAARYIKLFQSIRPDSAEEAYFGYSFQIYERIMNELFDLLQVKSADANQQNEIILPADGKISLSSSIEKHGRTKAINDLRKVEDLLCSHDGSQSLELLNSPTLFGFLKVVIVSEMIGGDYCDDLKKFIQTESAKNDETMLYLNKENDLQISERMKIVESKPYSDDPLWLMTSSVIYEGNKKLNEAINAAVHAARIWQGNTSWLVRIANLYQSTSDIENTGLYWNEAINLSADPENYIYQYSRFLLDKGEPQAVLSLYEKYFEKMNESYNFHRIKAEAFLKMKMIGDCQFSLTAARKYRGPSIDLDILESELYFLQGKFDQAKELIDRVLKENSQCVAAYKLSSKIHRESSNYQEAINILEAGLELNKGEKDLQIEMMRNLILKDSHSEALQLGLQLSNEYPEDVNILNILAEIYLELGDYHSAEMAARRSYQLMNDQQAANLLLGKVARQQGNLDQALAHLLKIVTITNENVEPLMEVGEIYLEKQEPKKALEVFQDACMVDENDYRPFYRAGLVHREMKNYSEAETMLKKASSLAPRDANIRRQLAAVVALNLVHAS